MWVESGHQVVSYTIFLDKICLHMSVFMSVMRSIHYVGLTHHSAFHFSALVPDPPAQGLSLAHGRGRDHGPSLGLAGHLFPIPYPCLVFCLCHARTPGLLVSGTCPFFWVIGGIQGICPSEICQATVGQIHLWKWKHRFLCFTCPFTLKVHSPNLSKSKCISKVARMGSIIIFPLSKLWKAMFSILWCYVSAEGAGKIWHWSLLGVKGLTVMLRVDNEFSGKGRLLFF